MCSEWEIMGAGEHERERDEEDWTKNLLASVQPRDEGRLDTRRRSNRELLP